MSNAFDRTNYPTQEPDTIVVGDRLLWRRDDLADTYPTSAYALTYEFHEDSGGYIHFPATVDEEYFKQLTAEKRIVKFYRGQKKLVWKQTRERNEALDNFVYALAGYYILSPNMNKIKNKTETTEEQPEQKQKRNTLLNRRRRNNWVNNW